MKTALCRLIDELGLLALASLALIAVAGVALVVALKPLEARHLALQQELTAAARRAQVGGLRHVGAETPEAKLAAFYRHFERDEHATEWLAKLYGVAGGAGVELRSGDYRLPESRQRLQRYQFTLPVSGSYAQVRTFVENALAEVPVLSLDQVTFRKRGANNARLEAEIAFTLHLVRK